MSLKRSQSIAAVLFVTCAIVVSTTIAAQSVSGTILIKKRLTRPSVTASVSVYQRGPSVKLGDNASEDPLAFERSRVVVYLEGPDRPADAAPETAPTEVRQIDRRFVPDLVVVPVGSTVSFPNMDPIFHNIYSLSKAKSFDLGSYDKGQSRQVTFKKTGIVEVYCHLHPNMAATVFVTPGRLYARPDQEGQYHIPSVPPGKYTVVAWHKSAGFFRKAIIVGESGEATADFFIPIDIDTKQPSQPDEAGREAGSR